MKERSAEEEDTLLSRRDLTRSLMREGFQVMGKIKLRSQ
jgi:hypothetical protein